jgi:carbon-monoxide dehydrogenase medium subunit
VLPKFELRRPRTVEDAIALLGEDVWPYCGGTELLLAMKVGLLKPATLVDLKGVVGLRGLALDDTELVIGAATSHADVAASDLARTWLPVLALVEHRVGNARVRAQGSVGGNLCFAEPRSDITTVLSALDATVVLVSARGERRVPVLDFLLGAYWCAREPDELLTEIRVPLGTFIRGACAKLQLSERPTVSVVAVQRQDGVRLGIGAVGDKPLVIDAASPADIDCEAVADQLVPLADLAGSARYKKHVTAVYARRAMAALAEGS